MSVITTVTLMVSNIDGDVGDSGSKTIGPCVAAIMREMDRSGFNGTLKDVTDATGGGNVPSPIFIGAFKVGDRHELVNCFMSQPWLTPEYALLIIQTEDGPYQVFCAKEKTEFHFGGEHRIGHLMERI